ncbi:MAG: DUF3794 domain-containing protein [Lachnospiraceae bacterium]|nr:DUF3794 domain-containing protein [Lachnospiraceae bacterium]
MDLLMKNIHMCHQAKHAMSQMTLDEDLNVPDAKPDVEMIIQSRGHIVLEHSRAESGKLFVDGFMEVGILYMDETKERQLYRLDAKLPFDEIIAVDALEPGENVRLRHETEDLSVSLINSRKLSIRALVRFEASVEEIYDLSAAVEIQGAPARSLSEWGGEPGARRSEGADVSGRSWRSNPARKDEAAGQPGIALCKKRESLEFLQLEVQKKDILRLKEDVQLPSNKPNIREVLWEDIQLRGCRTQLEEGRVSVRGSLFVFVLYRAEDEKESIQWMEQAVPLEGSLACDGCTAGLVPDVEASLSGADLTVKEDMDGEMRIFHLEGVLDLSICLYGSDTAEILSDVYSPEKDLELKTSDETYETLIVRNELKCRAQGKIRIQGAKPRILQICHSSGSVQIDKTEIVENGIKIEGALPVSILYISSDDSIPFAVLEGSIPFTHIAEAQGMDLGVRNGESESLRVARMAEAQGMNQKTRKEDGLSLCRYTLTPVLDQLSATMSDSEEIEIRASVGLNLFAVRTCHVCCIHEIREKDYDAERLLDVPGIVGYIVQEGDTLWDIAREYFSTPQQIMEMNGLTSENIKKGDCLILMKNIKMCPS